MLASGLSLFAEWSEVTELDYHYTVDPDGTLHTYEPDISHVAQSETLSPDGAQESTVPDDNGVYQVLATVAHAIAGPPFEPSLASGSRAYVTGLPLQPTCGVTMETLGGARVRQGFHEHTTAATANHARRYLTMTASVDPTTAPAGVQYSGALALVNPPEDYDAQHPDSTTPPTYPWDFQLLVLADSSNFSVFVLGFGDPPSPYSLRAVTDAVRTLDASGTTREMSTPAGLVLTLSDEQTPEDIRAAVDDLAATDWPEPGGDDPAPTTGFPGAKRFLAPSKDAYVAQRMRYRITHFANDNRLKAESSFTFTSRWRIRTTDLDTGEMEDDDQEREITHHGGQSSEVDAWVEVPVPATNQTVEVLSLPGASAAPHTFEDISVALVQAA